MTTTHNRVIWREGLFVRPQHFQQQQRHWDYLLQNRLHAMACFNQGVLQLQISEEHLHAGQIAVIQGPSLPTEPSVGFPMRICSQHHGD